jgi:hypothetical protein
MGLGMTISMLRPVLVKVGRCSRFIQFLIVVAPGIAVSNTPSMNTHAVADWTIFLMIGALRQISAPIRAFRSGTLNLPISRPSHDQQARKNGGVKTSLLVMIPGISYLESLAWGELDA